jgi:hypothetical protein
MLVVYDGGEVVHSDLHRAFRRRLPLLTRAATTALISQGEAGHYRLATKRPLLRIANRFDE